MQFRGGSRRGAGQGLTGKGQPQCRNMAARGRHQPRLQMLRCRMEGPPCTSNQGQPQQVTWGDKLPDGLPLHVFVYFCITTSPPGQRVLKKAPKESTFPVTSS